MDKLISFDDRVVVTSDNYCCGDVGSRGVIADNGYWDRIVKDFRYLIRFDRCPDMLYGVYQKDIEKEEKL